MEEGRRDIRETYRRKFHETWDFTVRNSERPLTLGTREVPHTTIKI